MSNSKLKNYPKNIDAPTTTATADVTVTSTGTKSPPLLGAPTEKEGCLFDKLKNSLK